ncbi:hypothetical protein BDP27DRAFT_1418617 [Rhodocollybia butyracea]|uniref:Mid2 domain-containing protein n=1 Tax=Rhodocollybia butyracea TaxID=206335 RepID=A0A9P5UA93_9AGAR|nr:hypothetical protein BDP27DRAFT_1418617 [Rhodocollybia butyracea]
MFSASHMLLVFAILSHTVLHILAFSIAIPDDGPVSNISFPVTWERDSTDSTVLSLDRLLEDSSTGVFSGGGIFANISGSQGQATTSTFYISPTFAVLSPAQGASTIVNSAETYLGTSFPLTPTSATSILSSPVSTSTSTNSTSIPNPSPITSSTGSARRNHNTGAIAGGVVGGIVAIFIMAALIFLLHRERLRSKNVGLIETHPITQPSREVSTQSPGFGASASLIHPMSSSFNINSSIPRATSEMEDAPLSYASDYSSFRPRTKQ